MWNEAKMSRRTLFLTLGWLSGIAIAGPLLPFVSHAAHGPQLKEMIEKGDHAGLAEYYKKQAEEARHKAEEMKNLAREYSKRDPKGQLWAKHCTKMAEKLLAEASENDALAELHSKEAKAAGK